MKFARCSLKPEIRAIYNELNQLTRETNKEYGLFICKKGAEIASGRMCIGTQCQVDVELKRDGCPRGYETEQFVHTHPRTGDNFSTADVSYAGGVGIDKLCVISPVTDSVTCLENLVRVHNFGRLHKDDFVKRHQALQDKSWDDNFEVRALMLAYTDDELEKEELRQVDKVRKKLWNTYHEGVGRLTDDYPKQAQVKLCTAEVK